MCAILQLNTIIHNHVDSLDISFCDSIKPSFYIIFVASFRPAVGASEPAVPADGRGGSHGSGEPRGRQ